MNNDERRYLVAGPDSTSTVTGTAGLVRRLSEADQAGACVAWRQIHPTDTPTSDTDDDRRVVDSMTDGGQHDTATNWNVSPSQSEWYWCAVVETGGETSCIDGYASGTDEPTLCGAPISDTVTVLEWSVQMTPGNRDYIADRSTTAAAASPCTSNADDDADGM